MQRAILVTITLLAGVALLGLGASTVDAQSTSPLQLCQDVTPYDHNTDGRLTGADFEQWVYAVHFSGDACELYGQAAGCPPWVDVDRDGQVSHLDLFAMETFLNTCVNTSPFVPGN